MNKSWRKVPKCLANVNSQEGFWWSLGQTSPQPSHPAPLQLKQAEGHSLETEEVWVSGPLTWSGPPRPWEDPQYCVPMVSYFCKFCKKIHSFNTVGFNCCFFPLQLPFPHTSPLIRWYWNSCGHLGDPTKGKLNWDWMGYIRVGCSHFCAWLSHCSPPQSRNGLQE